jgi:hypothetical protein
MFDVPLRVFLAASDMQYSNENKQSWQPEKIVKTGAVPERRDY